MCKVQTRSSFLSNIKTPFFGSIKLKAIFHSLHHLSYEMTIGARCKTLYIYKGLHRAPKIVAKTFVTNLS